MDGWGRILSPHASPSPVLQITFEETLFQKAADGTPFVDVMKAQGMIPGIKVDKGVIPLFGTDGETVTQGTDDLGKRCASYYAQGARFAKWRAVLKISDMSGATPSQLSIDQNAYTLARYAAICQVGGARALASPRRRWRFHAAAPEGERASSPASLKECV